MQYRDNVIAARDGEYSRRQGNGRQLPLSRFTKAKRERIRKLERYVARVSLFTREWRKTQTKIVWNWM
jgi:hypothetical protein